MLYFLGSPTLSSPSTKTRSASHLTGRYSCRVRTVVFTRWMNQGSLCSPIASTQHIKPPTKHALFQHEKRALLTVVLVWKQSLSKKHRDPSEWGSEWNTRTKQWVPGWTNLVDISHACPLSSTVDVRLPINLSAFQRNSAVAHCLTAIGAALVMTMKPDLSFVRFQSVAWLLQMVYNYILSPN